MTGAEESSLSPAQWGGLGEAAPAARAPRRRLFRKYALIFVALVGAALLINSSFDFWFSYQENKAALVRVQQEKAESAAQRIAEFVEEIKSQIGWTTHAQWAAGPLDQRRQDYVRLLRQVPAITELAQLDGAGKEQLKVSRLAMDVVGSEADFSQSPAFAEAKAHRTWFSPVYFRKESEPYMTLAMARDGRNAGVTVAEINLKLIWDVITALKIGQGGYAYVVDGRGRLIAHPDISLVLRDTDLSKLPQVAAALTPQAGRPAVATADNLAGRSVLTAHAAIPQLGWRVFVEVPLSEAFAPLYGAAMRTALLLAGGLIAAALVALLLARRMTGPIRAIAATAERIGAGDLSHRIDIHTGDELEGLAQQFNRMAGDLQKSYAELEQRVADRTAELSEALEQQTATAEVLGVINSSPGELKPVFEAVLDKATTLCDAAFGILWTYDGERFYPVALHRTPPRFADFLRSHQATGFGATRGNAGLGAMLDGAAFQQTGDPSAGELYRSRSSPLNIAFVELGGARSGLIVPLRKDATLLGAIRLFRQEVRPFTEKQIALLQNFAAQAVIAMENARLITETQEALEQQTATSEVLGIISSSPGDLEPVFDAMLSNAVRICSGSFGILALSDGDGFRGVAVHGVGAEFREGLTRLHSPPPGTGLYLLQQTARTIQVTDCAAEPAYDRVRAVNPAFAQVRTALHVPMLKESQLLGAILIFRDRVVPFGDKQTELVENFAKQAVIAIENARLITETREALEQQTATAEVLGVINASPGDLAPVFEAMLEKAMRLCEAAFGSLWTFSGDRFRPVAHVGLPAAYAEYLSQDLLPAGQGTGRARLLAGEPFAHIPDLADEPPYRDGEPHRLALVDLGGARTGLLVPLHKDAAVIGFIMIYRQEVRPFSDKQIALLQNFAAQAVIAMENARLITETREALEQQTATAEVLGVINSSPGDLAPVFDAILEKARTLCGAAFGTLMVRDGARFRAAALHNVPERFAEVVSRGFEPHPDSPIGRLVLGDPLIHLPDLRDLAAHVPDDPVPQAAVEFGGIRTLLMVPLRKEENLLGVIVAFRQEVRPFTEKQIALLRNFAAQAVIAMENARLITETQEALEQQTATAEVLGVINSSPGDLAPVFNAMLEKALRLCDAALGHLYMHDGERFEPAAALGDPEFSEWLFRRGTIRPVPNSPLSRILKGERCVEIPDARETEAYRAGGGYRDLVDSSGTRTHLAVPLRKDGAVLGVITIYRKEVRPFTDKQIALLQNFAAQAVIAMENARLITETCEALEQQTATAEVLGVINSSPGELVPVFDAMLEKAMRLCEAAFGFLTTYDGQEFSAAAQRGVPPKLAEYFTVGMDQPQPGDSHWRLLAGEDLVHNIDQMEDDAYRSGNPLRRAVVDLGGARSALVVALRKDNALLGAFTIYRKEVRAFSAKQVALVQNFAAQAVIAMENARLIIETREALEQQTATAEVLQVISNSMSDTQPVFDAIVHSGLKLFPDAAINVALPIEGQVHAVAIAEHDPARAAAWRRRFPAPLTREYMHSAAILDQKIVDIPDVREAPSEFSLGSQNFLASGYRAITIVPMRRGDAAMGALSVVRLAPGPLSEKQLAVLRTFADQAVIAIENARLITETREALEQQTATAEVLGVINSSPGDLAPVFDAMLEKATRLCEAAAGVLWASEGERFRAVASRGLPSAFEEFLRTPMTAGPDTGIGRLHRGEPVAHITDMAAGTGYHSGDELHRAAVDLGGIRSLLAVPLQKDGVLFGAFGITRHEVRPFTGKQIALLQNFAAQAVIAMENARLITETRERTRDLQESLEYQTATSDVLSVISRSTFDLQPVLETVAETAARLCDSEMAFILRRDGGVYRAAAALGWSPEYREYLYANPIVPNRGTVTGRVVLSRQAVHIADITQDLEYTMTEAYTLGGARTQLGVPLLREGSPIGVIVLSRQRVEPFTQKQIELVRTFADQAVIAIENARLLNELRDRTADLQESLEYQTATSDVLKVISQSGTDLDPALDTLVETASRLCAAERGIIWRLRDRQYHLAASFGFSDEFRELMASNPIEPGRGTLGGRTLAEGRPVQIYDAATDPEYTWTEAQRLGEFHSMLGVPLFRERTPIGVIAMVRSRIEPFTDKEIQLVSTFADQAVIAIENARLLGELRDRTDELARSVDELKALAEVGQEVSSTLDLAAVLSTILNRSVGLTGADAGVIFRYSEGQRGFHLAEAVGWDAALVAQVRDMRIDQSATLMGEAVTRRMPGQIADLRERPSNVLRDATLAAGYRSVLVVPLVGADQIFGALLLQRRRPGEFPDAEVRLMQTLAAQSVLAIQNAGLFREIADKSEQLALASQHKSQFLANMSHELRTPLNAILGYSELLVDGIYGAVPEKAMGVLERVQNNGKHLLALINDVLDLSKIEAGQLVLTLEDYALPDVVHSVVSAAEGLANTKGLKFSADVARGLPTGHGDARRLSQVLLNLVGNAIKFTDQGEVAVGAMAENGHFVLTVRDTGPGIAPEDHDKIFGEFQQVDNSNTRKKGGTGLGLAISKRMVEMQGGSIVVESKLGHGATFRVTLPIRVEHVADELAGELMGAA